MSQWYYENGYEAGYVDRRSAKQRRADAQWEALMSGDYDEDEDEEEYEEDEDE